MKAEVRRRWFSRRAFGLHAVIVVVIPSFAALCIWQVGRALGGNQLSWAYVFEWPFFGGYAVYMWWRFIHEDAPETDTTTPPVIRSAAMPPADATTGTTHPAAADADEADDEQLAAYNTYLAELAARDTPKQWH